LEFLNFIKRINANVPDDLDIHLVVENYSPRKYVKPWLADHHLHHAHDYASWLNQVENWFNILTQKAIRRGTFRSVKEFAAKIDNFVSRYDPKSQPFIWIATDGSIREKLQRILTQIALPRSG
jgi:putative transposase